MKLNLDLKILVDEDPIDASTLVEQMESHREKITDVGDLEGAIVVKIGSTEHCGEYYDPLLRLVDQWTRKIPWVLGGDTETVALRNSEHCYAFVPTGDSLEFSFFVGSETEIEEYVVEPVNVLLETFTTQTIELAGRLLEIVRTIDPALIESHEDCVDLARSLNESRKAWRDHQLHRRR